MVGMRRSFMEKAQQQNTKHHLRIGYQERAADTERLMKEDDGGREDGWCWKYGVLMENHSSSAGQWRAFMGKTALSTGIRVQLSTESESQFSCVLPPIFPLLCYPCLHFHLSASVCICLSFPHSPVVLFFDCNVLKIINRLQLLALSQYSFYH